LIFPRDRTRGNYDRHGVGFEPRIQHTLTNAYRTYTYLCIRTWITHGARSHFCVARAMPIPSQCGVAAAAVAAAAVHLPKHPHTPHFLRLRGILDCAFAVVALTNPPACISPSETSLVQHHEGRDPPGRRLHFGRSSLTRSNIMRTIPSGCNVPAKALRGKTVSSATHDMASNSHKPCGGFLAAGSSVNESIAKHPPNQPGAELRPRRLRRTLATCGGPRSRS